MDKEAFVAQGWELIEAGMRELADLAERSAADIARGRRLTRWAHELDAFERRARSTSPDSSRSSTVSLVQAGGE